MHARASVLTLPAIFAVAVLTGCAGVTASAATSSAQLPVPVVAETIGTCDADAEPVVRGSHLPSTLRWGAREAE